jgi:alanine racemase
MPRPIRAAISASALAHNFAIARRHAGAAKVWAVLKANAYGHGLERAARALAAADGFAVLDFQEAARLRALGVQKPVLMLEGVFDPGDVELLQRHSLVPVVHAEAQIEMLRTVAAGAKIDCYLKANTGMNRLGFDAAGLRAAYEALRALPQVGAVTLMTHFADADGAAGIAGQLAVFDKMIKPLGPAPRSLANSAALLRFPRETAGDWVRPGIMLYGCSPFSERSAESLGLKPVMTLSSKIIAVQRLKRGERVGYGFSYEATGALTIGIVACGYADGYPRHAPSGTPVLVNGERAPTVGRVSMDMIAVDLTQLQHGQVAAGIGTPVTLWGEGLSADEVGAAAGTLSYELFTKLTGRVPVVEVS